MPPSPQVCWVSVSRIFARGPLFELTGFLAFIYAWRRVQRGTELPTLGMRGGNRGPSGRRPPNRSMGCRPAPTGAANRWHHCRSGAELIGIPLVSRLARVLGVSDRSSGTTLGASLKSPAEPWLSHLSGSQAGRRCRRGRTVYRRRRETDTLISAEIAILGLTRRMLERGTTLRCRTARIEPS
jgi:hypothetical protein